MIRIILLLLLPLSLFSQTGKVTLNELLTRLDSVYPIIKNYDVYAMQMQLTNKKIRTAYFPTINLNWQTSYQSDVTELNIDFPSMPNIEMPETDKDQYKFYADVNQILFDGGRTRVMQDIESKQYGINQKSDEVKLYQIKLQISELFFNILKLRKTADILDIGNKQMQDQLEIVQSGIKNGILSSSAKNELKAEIISTNQKITELHHQEIILIKTLNIFLAESYDTSTVFRLPVTEEYSFARPEYEYFNLSKEQLEAKSKLLQKNRSPLVFAFGQVGYGKPGLNMLSNQFKGYYIAGLKIIWNIYDWNKTKYDKQNITAGIHLIDNNIELFNQSVQAELVKQNEEIDKLTQIMVQDQQIIKLRDNIVKSSASKLKNGVIRPKDYAEDVNSYSIAKINYEIHKIELIKAKINYQLIKGN